MTVLKTATQWYTEPFTYNTETRTFSIEDSDVDGFMKSLGRIYNDAADEGFWLVSQWTGDERPFVLWQTHTREGDITHWEFREIYKSSGRVDETGLKVIVFND